VRPLSDSSSYKYLILISLEVEISGTTRFTILTNLEPYVRLRKFILFKHLQRILNKQTQIYYVMTTEKIS
jgi:hypothetical protein